ncbi:MAG: hypothetical protein V4467_04605 [Patescibacteria group bacterium]
MEEGAKFVPRVANKEAFDLAREYVEAGKEPDEEFDKKTKAIIAAAVEKRERRRTRRPAPTPPVSRRQNFQTGSGAMAEWQKKREDGEK